MQLKAKAFTMKNTTPQRPVREEMTTQYIHQIKYNSTHVEHGDDLFPSELTLCIATTKTHEGNLTWIQVCTYLPRRM